MLVGAAKPLLGELGKTNCKLFRVECMLADLGLFLYILVFDTTGMPCFIL